VSARRRDASHRGRPQSAAVTAALMRATLDVVAARGYHAATVGEIVARARSSKPTVYRRWPSKPRLVADAVRFALDTANPSIPTSGLPLADLRAVVGNVIHALRTTPLARVLGALLGAAADHPALAAALAEVERERRRVLRAVVVRAGGHHAADRDVDLDVDLILGALYFRVLMRRMDVDARLAARLAKRLYGRSCDGS